MYLPADRKEPSAPVPDCRLAPHALFLFAWLVVGRAGALGAVRSPGLRVAAATGIVAAAGSLVTARAQSADLET